MIAQKEQGKKYKQDSNNVSSRYEGLSEHNLSHYVLLGASADNNINVTMLPTPHAVQSFAQPARVQTMSMTEAEQAIADQRSHMTRYMLHQRAAPGEASAPSNTKSRLLGKLKALTSKSGNADDDGDDIMGDVKFATRKGGGSRARSELLSSMADGIAMDADGVMGGANDAEFGGKRRFMKNFQGQKANTVKSGAGATSTSNDGNAMADDFYQRDVKAEYEELDYDPSQQFDNDDVDLGEGEMNMMDGGFAEDLEEDDDIDEDEEDEEDEEKKAGLATVKGLKDMLAKARGETPADKQEGEKKDEDENGGPSSPASALEKKEAGDGSNNNNNNNLAQVVAAREAENAAAPEIKKGPIAVQLDEKGQRILTMEGVRYEIFLHNKSISMKKLMKLYNIKKKTEKERIKQFQAIIKELCNMHKDPVQGNMLALKQHYSKAQV